VIVEIRVEVTIKAEDTEQIGRAMGEVYQEVVKTVASRPPVALPGFAPGPATVQGTYPRNIDEKEKV
jgi:hypothetical protein